jgi:hypothetical protein
MKISVMCFWLQKAGNASDEYEDAFDLSYNRRGQNRLQPTPGCLTFEREVRHPVFAIADGASDGAYPAMWAQSLVRSCARQGPRTSRSLRRLVEGLGKRQMEALAGEHLPWWTAQKVRQGDYAALLSLSLSPNPQGGPTGGRWTTLAVGDVCLFQIHQDELVARFPVESSDELGYNPVLLCTVAAKNERVWGQTGRLRRTGVWLPGDTFILMTDALAHWFLTRVERGEKPWHTLIDLGAPPPMILQLPLMDEQALQKRRPKRIRPCQALIDRFGGWADQSRASGALRNDDVTLLMITVGENHESATVR